MPKRLSLFVLTPICLLMGIHSSLSAQGNNFEAGQVRVFQAVGEVIAVKIETRKSRELKRGDTVTEGHMIATGEKSSAVLLFSNGSSVSIGEKTHLNIDEFKQKPYDKSKGSFMILEEDPSESITSLMLNHGELLGSVKHLQPRSSFEVSTPLGTAGIRGTKFYVAFGIDEDTGKYVMKISNISGQVYVESATSGGMSFGGKDATKGEFDPNSMTNVQDVPEKSVITIEAGEIPLAAMLNMLYSVSEISDAEFEFPDDDFTVRNGRAYRVNNAGQHTEIGDDQLPPELREAVSKETLKAIQDATGQQGSGRLTSLNFDQIISAGQSFRMDTQGNLREVSDSQLPSSLNQGMSLESLERLIQPIIDAMRGTVVPSFKETNSFDQLTQNPNIRNLANQLQGTLGSGEPPILGGGQNNQQQQQGKNDANIPDNNQETNPNVNNIETPENVIKSP